MFYSNKYHSYVISRHTKYRSNVMIPVWPVQRVFITWTATANEMWGVQQFNHCLIDQALATGTIYKALLCTRYRPDAGFSVQSLLGKYSLARMREMFYPWATCGFLCRLKKDCVRSHFSRYQALNQQKVDYCLKHQGVPGLLGLVDLVPKRKGHSLTLCSYPGFDLWILNNFQVSTV